MALSTHECCGNVSWNLGLGCPSQCGAWKLAGTKPTLGEAYGAASAGTQSAVQRVDTTGHCLLCKGEEEVAAPETQTSPPRSWLLKAVSGFALECHCPGAAASIVLK